MSGHVFISHASREKHLARDIKERLTALGFAVWLDEEHIPPSGPFPPRLQQALDAASHLLVVLTPAWLAGEWTLQELRDFLARGVERPIVPYVPERLERREWPQSLSKLAAVHVDDLGVEEVDWQLYCAITNTNSGPRPSWPARARQVRVEHGPVPDFSREELLELAGRRLAGRPSPEHVDRNLALHCLRIGLSPTWLERGWDPVALAWTYLQGAERLPESARPGLWRRLARALDRVEPLTELVGEDEALVRLFGATSEAEALAILRLLRHVPLSRSAIDRLIRWIDPDADGGPPADTAARVLGWTAVVDETLALLFARPDVEPLALFRGHGSRVFGEVGWLSCFVRRIVELAQADRLGWEAVAGRLREELDGGDEYPAPRLALCDVLGGLPRLPPELDEVAQMLLSQLRRWRREPWLSRRLQLCRQLVERLPRVVFLHLGTALYAYADSAEALAAARVAGLSAQEPEDIEELLARCLHTRDARELAMLFETVLGSPADLSDLEASVRRVVRSAGALNPLADALARLLHSPRLRKLQAAVESSGWQAEAPAFLRAEPPHARELWPYVLAREYANTDAASELRWRGLLRCVQLAVMDIAEAATPLVRGEAVERLAALSLELEPSEFLARWDHAAEVILGLGADLADQAEALQARLRWLQTILRGVPTRGRLRLLESRLQAWFAAYPDLMRPLTERPTVTFRFCVSEEPIWLSLCTLLEDPEVVTALADGPATSAAMQAFAAGERGRSVAHRLVALEEMFLWATRLLASEPGLRGAGFLWGLLGRTCGYRSPDLPERELHAAIVAALVGSYAHAPEHLQASLDGMILDVESRVAIVLAAYAAQPGAWEGRLLAELAELHAEPAAESLAIEALQALRRAPSQCALPLLRELVDAPGTPAVATAAAGALLAASTTPDDILRVLRFALNHPSQLPEINEALDAHLTAEEPKHVPCTRPFRSLR